MADLLTHYVSARIVGVKLRDRAVATLFALGVFLPDLIGKPIRYLPGSGYMTEIPSHTPFGLIFACGAISMLFASNLRVRAFWALYAGSLLHLLVDLMKDYLGSGAAFLLHPFSLETYELGLYRSEDVYYLLPANVAILIILWVMKSKRESAESTRDDG